MESQPTDASRPPAPPVEDEFAGIPSPRRGRHPVLAVGVLLLGAFLLFHARRDLTFALSSSTPLELGDAGRLFRSPSVTVPENRLVRISGLPDRESALDVDTKGSWKFAELFRVLGTNGRLFLFRPEDPLPAAKAERDQFTGRLIRFADLSFHDSISKYFAGHVTATHSFRPEVFFAALTRQQQAGTGAGSNAPISVAERTGEHITLKPSDVVSVDVGRSATYFVGVPKEKFPTVDAARAAIAKTGATIASEEPATAKLHQFVISIPGADDAAEQPVLAALGDLAHKMEVRRARWSHRVRLADFHLSTDGSAGPASVKFRNDKGGDVDVAMADVLAVRTLAAIEIPKDALLLIEGELPRSQWHVVAAAIAIALFMATNITGLWRGLMSRARG